jgi:type IV secretion system protein VirB9
VRSDATELPALYELKDGKPAIVNFQVREGIYVVPKVLDRGYLVLGTQRFTFEQRAQ